MTTRHPIPPRLVREALCALALQAPAGALVTTAPPDAIPFMFANCTCLLVRPACASLPTIESPSPSVALLWQPDGALLGTSWHLQLLAASNP